MAKPTIKAMDPRDDSKVQGPVRKPKLPQLPTYQEAKRTWETLLHELSEANLRWERAKQECHELNQRVTKARDVIREVLAQDGVLDENYDD